MSNKETSALASRLRTPAECLTSQVEVDGERYSLCVVKHHWSDEGTATIEHLSPDDNAKGEPRAAQFLDHGVWTIKHGVLVLEFNQLDDMADDPPAIVNALVRALDLSLWDVESAREYP